MKLLLFFVFALCLASCNKIGQPKTDKIIPQKDSIIFEEVCDPEHESVCFNLKFLGHDIICEENNIIQEFSRICSEDNNLSFDSINQNISIYGTTFHLNYRNDSRGFMLMSSVQPDTRQIRIVRDAISKFHGKENFEEDCHYSWLPYTDSTKIRQNYPVIHLRRVHSEEGGTAIIVN